MSDSPTETEKDAARYRWIASDPPTNASLEWLDTKAEMDEFIDAAIAGKLDELRLKRNGYSAEDIAAYVARKEAKTATLPPRGEATKAR